MKILVDECIDRRFVRILSGHQAAGVQEIGWRSIKNGELPRRAESEFDVFLTVDRNLAFQQPISRLSIRIVVLRARSNDISTLGRLVPRLLSALPESKPGEVLWIGESE